MLVCWVRNPPGFTCFVPTTAVAPFLIRVSLRRSVSWVRPISSNSGPLLEERLPRPPSARKPTASARPPPPPPPPGSMRFIFFLSVFLMAAGLGAESLAAKFKQGGALGTYRGKWLPAEAADTATDPPGTMGSSSSGLSWASRCIWTTSKAADSREGRKAETSTSSSFRTGSWWAG